MPATSLPGMHWRLVRNFVFARPTFSCSSTHRWQAFLALGTLGMLTGTIQSSVRRISSMGPCPLSDACILTTQEGQ